MLKILKKLRIASLNSKFAGSYKKFLKIEIQENVSCKWKL